MQIVIDMQEDDYRKVQDGRASVAMMRDAIRNGKPLPEGHERLIDVGQCDKELFYQQCGGADSLITVKSAFDMLMSLPTIIEADKEEINADSN